MCTKDLQRPNIYNQYLPCYQKIEQQASALFEEIRENLSRSIQLDEFRPGFVVWSYKLKEFISIYGFFFTKLDHVKIIQFYLSLLTINELSCMDASTCFDMLKELSKYVILYSCIY